MGHLRWQVGVGVAGMVSRLRVVRRRLTDTPFVSVLAIIGVNNAVTLFTHPERVPTHLLLTPFDYLWAVLYGLGGLGILVGIAARLANVEVAGYVAFASGSLISALTWALVRGVTAWNTVLVLVLFAVAALIRVHHAVHGRVLVLVERDHRTVGNWRVVGDGESTG